MTTSSPTTTRPQHEVAFERANEVRLLRAALKRMVAASEPQQARGGVAHTIEYPEWWVEGIPLLDLLRAIPKVGPRTAQLYLRRAGVMRGKPTIRDLTDRQRGVLVDALREPRRRD